MAVYIINDFGYSEKKEMRDQNVLVFTNHTEKIDNKNIHIYNSIGSKMYSYSQFYRKAFSEDDNTIISSIKILENDQNKDEMYFGEGNYGDPNLTYFPSTSYYKVEVKKFHHEKDEETGKPLYYETTDVYQIMKSHCNILISGIEAREKTLELYSKGTHKRIEKIKQEIDRKNKVSEITKAIIDDYFDNNGKIREKYIGEITSSELKKELKENQKELALKITKKDQLTKDMRIMEKIFLGSSIASVVGGLTAKGYELTQTPPSTQTIISAFGTLFITYFILNQTRMHLVDTKIGKIKEAFIDKEQEQKIGHRTK